MDKVKRTGDLYGLLWTKPVAGSAVDSWHYDAMQKVIGVPIVRGSIGIEVGSGCGYDTYLMAKTNPSVRIVSTDMSDGISNTRRITSGLGNVETVRCSALAVPFRNGIFDFAYSFGVLHHTADPERGLSEMSRVLKPGGPAFLYLYEDHSENRMKRIGVAVASFFRIFTVRIPARALYVLSWALSPFVYFVFTLPAKIMSRFAATAKIAADMPFNFGVSPFSLGGDLYDRLGAPIERRYSRKQVLRMLESRGFRDITITRLEATAGWVAWGFRNND